MSTNRTLLFVYGTLKRGGAFHHLLRDSEFMGTGRTFDRYPMIVDGIPYVIETNAGNHIEGELFSVGPGELVAIDAHESHPNWSCRKLKTVMVAGDPFRAYVYFLQSIGYGRIPDWQNRPFHSVYPIPAW